LGIRQREDPCSRFAGHLRGGGLGAALRRQRRRYRADWLEQTVERVLDRYDRESVLIVGELHGTEETPALVDARRSDWRRMAASRLHSRSPDRNSHASTISYAPMAAQTRS